MVHVKNPVYGGNFATDSAGLIPFVLPGEVLQPDTLQVLQASGERVEPGCVHFGACGGCQYQYAAYPRQVQLKLEILNGIFEREGLVGLSAPVLHQGPAWGYRNRIRLRLQAGQLGYSRRASNDFLPIRMCPIAAPILWRAAEILLELAQSNAAAAQWLAASSELELFCAADESRLQATFFVHGPEEVRSQSFAALCDGWRERVPQLAGAGAVLDPDLNRRSRRKARWPGAAWGADGLAYAAAGLTFWVPRGAFFQVNRFLIDELVTLVCAGESGGLAWDLFAGVGLFTRALAGRFREVVAVEGSEPAAAALAAAGRPGKDSAGFAAVHSPTLNFLRGRRHQRERPSLVVLDPPRAGVGAEGAEILAAIGPESIVYVSCDPTSLARDLSILTRTYEAGEVHLVDLFPQTFHMETVVKLSRR